MNLPVGLHNNGTGCLSHLFGIWSEMNGNKAFCSLLLLLCKTLALVVPVQVFIFPNYCSAGATYQEVQGIMLRHLPESRNCRQGSGKTCSTFLPNGIVVNPERAPFKIKKIRFRIQGKIPDPTPII